MLFGNVKFFWEKEVNTLKLRMIPKFPESPQCPNAVKNIIGTRELSGHEAEAGSCVSSSLAWSIEEVPGQPRLYSVRLSQKTQHNKKELSGLI